MTFSIAAWDPEVESGPEWGVAVASKFLAVGSVVPFAEVGAGAGATQALANLAYAPDSLARLHQGDDAATVVRALTKADPDADQRQLGLVDAQGRAAGFTGNECFEWAGDVQGDGFTCQGNILTGPDVVHAMKEAFSSSTGDLAARLLAALSAGDAAGGDRRGRQSAALFVVRRGAGYGGASDVAVDLRVDDHPAPVDELARLLELHRLLYPRPEELEFLPIDEELGAELRTLLAACGHPTSGSGGYDSELRDALFAFSGTENLEERWTEGPKIEVKVLEYLRASGRSS
ncbi:MAG: DUF1028 domain-containing protein [Actinomycetota bacterium]|nr:DUF1028 domain-containing protein [Actinomycetota bacterium]